MIKKFKKRFIGLACSLVILGGVVTSNSYAAEYIDYSSSSFSVGVFLKGGTKYSVKNPYFITTQRPVTSGHPCGVQYQLRNDGGTGTPLASKTLANVQTGYKVSLSYSGTTKAYLKNYRSKTYPQTANGYFYTGY